MKYWLRVTGLGAMVLSLNLVVSAPAEAQMDSGESIVLLSALLPEALTVTLLPPATTFVLQGGSATNPAVLPVSAVTVWTLSLTRTNLKLYGYFTDASAALVHTFLTNTNDIPSSRVEVAVNGGSFAAFDQSVPFGGASAGREIWTQSVTALTATGLRTDTLTFNINLNNYPLPADAYVGTLRVRAQATP